MAIERLYEEIRKLSPDQKKKLFERLSVEPKRKSVMDELIGIAEGPRGKGSATYKEDLYGGSKPL